MRRSEARAEEPEAPLTGRRAVETHRGMRGRRCGGGPGAGGPWGWSALPGFVRTGRWASQRETLLGGSLTYRFPFLSLGHVDLKNIHNPKVESFMLFSGNF